MGNDTLYNTHWRHSGEGKVVVARRWPSHGFPYAFMLFLFLMFEKR